MGTVRVLRWFCLMCTLPLIYGNDAGTELKQRVETLEREGAAHKELIALLIQRLDRQEEQIQIQALTLEKQQTRLNRQDDQMTSQSKTLEKQKQLLTEQSDQLQSQSRTIGEQQLRMDRLEDQLKLQSQTLKKQQQLLNGHDDQLRSQSRILRARNSVVAGSLQDDVKQKRLVLGAEGPVAFHAVIDTGEVAHIGVGQKIVFDVVLENLGMAYQNQHGIFTAPVNGVYIFSVSVLSWLSNHSEFHAALKKDGVELARAFGHGDSGRHDQGSVTVVTQLKLGNQVWVENVRITDDSIYGGRYSTFMGCLIYPE